MSGAAGIADGLLMERMLQLRIRTKGRGLKKGEEPSASFTGKVPLVISIVAE